MELEHDAHNVDYIKLDPSSCSTMQHFRVNHHSHVVLKPGNNERAGTWPESSNARLRHMIHPVVSISGQRGFVAMHEARSFCLFQNLGWEDALRAAERRCIAYSGIFEVLCPSTQSRVDKFPHIGNNTEVLAQRSAPRFHTRR